MQQLYESSPHRFLAAVIAYLAVVVAVSIGVETASAARAAPRLANPTGMAKPLVLHFFVLAANKDRAGLQRLLSPAFQVQRADGSTEDKTQFLANLSRTVKKFYISSLSATQARGALVVRYLARVEGSLNGKPYTPGPAPRLSVFAWNGDRWQLAAHANFDPLTG